MKVIGVRELDFKGSDGNPVKGTQVFLTSPMDAPAVGEQAIKVFLTPERLEAMGFIPQVGDEVKPEYNQYGKVSALIPLE